MAIVISQVSVSIESSVTSVQPSLPVLSPFSTSAFTVRPASKVNKSILLACTSIGNKAHSTKEIVNQKKKSSDEKTRLNLDFTARSPANESKGFRGKWSGHAKLHCRPNQQTNSYLKTPLERA
jgi:hypothetical protein